jgi:hypothetical protein
MAFPGLSAIARRSEEIALKKRMREETGDCARPRKYFEEMWSGKLSVKR